MKEIQTIIWDWNGTLLDDIDICLESINTLLVKRNIAALSRERYKSIFRFPVKEYYLEAGFDFSVDPFDSLAHEFIHLYHNKLTDAGLYPFTRSVLKILNENGLRQYLVSAMEHKALKESLLQRNLLNCFEDFTGIRDHYASSKTYAARSLIEKNGLDISTTCLIGDTDHDQAVAMALGCNCILVSNGHQSMERLQKLNGKVLNNIGDIPEFFGIPFNKNTGKKF